MLRILEICRSVRTSGYRTRVVANFPQRNSITRTLRLLRFHKSWTAETDTANLQFCRWRYCKIFGDYTTLRCNFTFGMQLLHPLFYRRRNNHWREQKRMSSSAELCSNDLP